MDLKSDTHRFIEELQDHFSRKLAYPREVGFLMEQALVRNMEDVFRDAIFQAKFVTKTREVMNRIGREGDGFDKLSSEFQSSIEKSSALLKTIVKESSEEIKQPFIKEFFGLDQESFGNFLKLLEDLSWVKNFELDGKTLPLGGSATEGVRQHSHNPSSREDLIRIRNGAVLSIVMMILLFFVDAPVTFLGWGLAIVVALMLLYIAVTSHRIVRKSRTSN